MKKIINPNRAKLAIYKTRKSIAIILAFIASIASIIPFGEIIWSLLPPQTPFIKSLIQTIFVAILFLILFIIISVFFYFLKRFSIKKNKLKISIRKGDILNDRFLLSTNVLIFACDKDITLNFDKTPKISRSTIHGQFIEKFSDSIDLENKEHFLKQISYSSKKMKAFLVPLTEIKKEDDYRAKIRSDKDFLSICRETIEFIDGHNDKKILMPIIGAGETSRGKKAALNDKTFLIDLWIALFQIYCDRSLEITFVVRESDWQEIRFKELK